MIGTKLIEQDTVESEETTTPCFEPDPVVLGSASEWAMQVPPNIMEEDGGVEHACSMLVRNHAPFHLEYYTCPVCFWHDGALGRVLYNYTHEKEMAEVGDGTRNKNDMRAIGCTMLFQKWPGLMEVLGLITETDKRDKRSLDKKMNVEYGYFKEKCRIRHFIGLCVKNAIEDKLDDF